MKFVQTVFFFGILLLASCNGCRQIPANQIVLNSGNYGKTWEVVTGTVPSCNLPGCYNVYLPATVMVGDVSSIQRVGPTGESARVKMLYTYQWEISEPLSFIKEAKELKNGDYTTDGSLEFIEGRLVDKHFHDISATLLVHESVRNFDQAAFEKKLITALNEDMSRFGVRILNISVVPEFGKQLEEALDAASALDFYKSIGEEELGKEIIKQSAGAPKITIQNITKESQPSQE
jgi:hypothetical protein